MVYSKFSFALFTLLIIFGLNTYANNQVIFMPQGKQVLVLLKNAADSKNLFNIMSGPIEGISGGYGRVIKNEDKSLSVTCAYKSTPENMICNLVLKQSEYSSIKPDNGTAYFHIANEPALHLISQFINDYPLFYDTGDKILEISVNSESLEIKIIKL